VNLALSLNGVTYHRLARLGEAVAYAQQQLAAADRKLVCHTKVYSRCRCGLAWVCPDYVAAIGDANLWTRQLKQLPQRDAARTEPAQPVAEVVW
jgi:hypothetical protein